MKINNLGLPTAEARGRRADMETFHLLYEMREEENEGKDNG
jgi:hypothetical protein